MPTGFSMAMRGTFASANIFTNRMASDCSSCLSSHHRAPLTARWVQGGGATMRSHDAFSAPNTGICRCGPGRSVGSKSQLTASCPRAANASRTMPLNSHATRTLTTPPLQRHSRCTRTSPWVLLVADASLEVGTEVCFPQGCGADAMCVVDVAQADRSEEHTSELQSLRHL